MTYVPVDLVTDSIVDLLPAAGFVTTDLTVFIVEGVTMYLPEANVAAMFASLAELAGPGSRLAASFTASGGGSVSPASQAIANMIRATWNVSGECTHHWATEANVPPLLARSGWTPSESLTGPELAQRCLSATAMNIAGVNPQAFCVAAFPSPRTPSR